MINASLEIHNDENEVEVGILYGSSLDLNAEELRAFTDLAFESAKTRQKGLMNFRIHTFACEFCPDEIKEQNCLSNGQYCAFFPKDSNVEQDKVFADEIGNNQKRPIASKQIDFTGRDLLVASLYEKCFHDNLSGLIER